MFLTSNFELFVYFYISMRISSGSLWGVTSQLEMFFNFDPLFCIPHLYLRTFLSLRFVSVSSSRFSTFFQSWNHDMNLKLLFWFLSSAYSWLLLYLVTVRPKSYSFNLYSYNHLFIQPACFFLLQKIVSID